MKASGRAKRRLRFRSPPRTNIHVHGAAERREVVRSSSVQATEMFWAPPDGQVIDVVFAQVFKSRPWQMHHQVPSIIMAIRATYIPPR